MTLPQPSERRKQRIELAEQRSRKRLAPVSVRLATGDGAKVVVTEAHTDREGYITNMLDAFGTVSEAFGSEMLAQILTATAPAAGRPTEQSINAALALVEAVAPQNEIEAMLAVQMAATHSAAMMMLERAKTADGVPAMQQYGTLATKHLRTFAVQIEVLSRTRRGSHVAAG